MSNTFLMATPALTLKGLSSYVGSDSVNRVLNVNGLDRKRDVGGQLASRGSAIIASNPSVSWRRKSEILNMFSTDSDVFEYAALQNEDGWKVLSSTMSFSDALSIPDGVDVPRYDDILGNRVPVSSILYDKVMKSLESVGYIDSSILGDFSTIKPIMTKAGVSERSAASSIYAMFNVPWGDITLYSSLSGDSKDIPVYPETIKDGRTASYSTMPDTLYQYEPWYTYNSSGPRSLSVSFHMHRQMWTGDERDGKANELIRFCEASTYPRYRGSSVNTDTCTLYIKGYPYITGIVSGVDVEWDGPIGLDGFHLEFTMTISFTEVSTRALSYDVVRTLPLIG